MKYTIYSSNAKKFLNPERELSTATYLHFSILPSGLYGKGREDLQCVGRTLTIYNIQS